MVEFSMCMRGPSEASTPPPIMAAWLPLIVLFRDVYRAVPLDQNTSAVGCGVAGHGAVGEVELASLSVDASP